MLMLKILIGKRLKVTMARYMDPRIAESLFGLALMFWAVSKAQQQFYLVIFVLSLV